MTARTGMTELIQEVRRLTVIGTADFTVGTATYFSDDHVQDILDRYRAQARRIPLTARSEYVDGDTIYKEYPLPYDLEWVERGTAADSGWALRDVAGSAVAGTAYTVNYEAKVISFGVDTNNTTYYLDARNYELNRAAADIWGMKAGFIYDAIDWSSDNHSIKAEQEYQHCLDMAEKFKLMGSSKVNGGIRVGVMRRTDTW